MTDETHLRWQIEDFLTSARCPGVSAPHGMSHCAECCMGTGWLATDDRELDLLRALDRAAQLLARPDKGLDR